MFYDSPVTATSTSPLISDHQISSDPEPDADDWDLDPAEFKAQIEEAQGGGHGASGDALHLEEINWYDFNVHVEAAILEIDDESVDGRSERGVRSEDEFTDEASASRYVDEV